MHRRFADRPLGASPGPSRFSAVPAHGLVFDSALVPVLYAASDLATAAYETLIRDRFDLRSRRRCSPRPYGLGTSA